MNHTTPLYALPSELTALIFAFAIQSLNPTDARRLPLKLSQVTRRWRDIALGTGSLWTDIDLSPPWAPIIITLYLTRSGTYPIDLTFVMPPPHATQGTPDIDRVFALIAPHLPRCRTLYFASALFQDTHCPPLSRLVELVSSQALPQLQQLSLDRTGSSKAPLVLHAPGLTHLRLSGARPFSPDTGLRSLTTLHLSVPTPYTLLFATLASCPALATLAIYERSIEDWPPPHIAPTPLPALRSLQLYGHRMCKVSETLLAVAAPALADLVIAPVVPHDLALLHRAAPGKFPALHTLTLAPAHADAFAVLPAAWECFPSVRHLALANVYADAFAEVFADEGEGVLWPSLESLAVREVSARMARLVRRVVALRAKRGCPLRRVRLDARSCERLRCGEFGFGVPVEKVDVWGEYQGKALFRDVVDKFLGRPDDDE